MRIPVVATLLAFALLATPAPAGEEDHLREILKRLKRIEERLDRIGQKLATWSPPPQVGPVSPEHRTPVDVAVSLDLRTLEITKRRSNNRGSPGRVTAHIFLQARVKLLRCPQAIRGLQLTLFSSGDLGSRTDHPWSLSWRPGPDEKWSLGEERTIGISTMVSANDTYPFQRTLPWSIWEELSGTPLHLYVDHIHFEDDTTWWDARKYWVAKIAQLEQGMSFEAVRKILPGYDKDVGVQAVPGKPELRSWMLSPRWLVHVTFDKEGMTGKPVLIPVGTHIAERYLGHGD